MWIVAILACVAMVATILAVSYKVYAGKLKTGRVNGDAAAGVDTVDGRARSVVQFKRERLTNDFEYDELIENE